MEDGFEAMQGLLEEDRPDRIFAYSDIPAIGAMKSILEAKLLIPEDIALIGYDDTEFASMLEVPLTTVRQPRYRIGEAAESVVLRPELIL